MSRTQPWRSVGVPVAVAVLAWAFASAAWAGEAEVREILNLAPNDAQMIMVIPKPADLSPKIASLMKTLRIDQPWAKDPMGFLKKDANLAKGLDEKGPFGAVIMKTMATAADGSGIKPIRDPKEMEIFLILPTTDYAALLENLQGKAGEGVVEIKMSKGETSYARKEGRFALLSPSKAVLENYKKPGGADRWLKAAGGLGLQTMSKADAVVLTNNEAIAPALQAMLKENMTQAVKKLDDSPMAEMAPQYLELAKSMVTMVTSAESAVFRDMTVSVIAADLSDEGVGLTIAGQFKPGSELSKIFTSGGGSAELLSRLPDVPYLVASATNFKGVDVKRLSRELVTAIGKKDDPITELIRSYAPLLEAIDGSAELLPVPAMADMASGIKMIKVTKSADPATLVKQFRKSWEAMSKVELPMAVPGDKTDADAKVSSVKFKTKYAEKVATVDGVDIDQFDVEFILPDEILKVQPMLLMMAQQRGYLAVVDGHVVSTTIADKELMRSAIAAVKASKGLASNKSLAAFRETALWADPSSEAYLNIGEFVKFVAPILDATMNVKLPPVPADMPPVAMGAKVQDNGVALRVYAPVKLLAFTRTVVEKLEKLKSAKIIGPAPQPKGSDDGAPPAPR